jgi:hypothetical protein
MIFASSRSLMFDSIEEDLKTERDACSSIEDDWKDDLFEDLEDDLEDDLIRSGFCSNCLPFFDILN